MSFIYSYLAIDDHSRVKLQVRDGMPHTDYINACFVKVGYINALSTFFEWLTTAKN